MNEASLERRCRRVTKARGGVLLKFLPWLARGFPDRILLLPGGWIAFLEFKAAKGSLRKMQDWWMRRLVGLGFRWFEVRTYAQFEEILSLWGDRGQTIFLAAHAEGQEEAGADAQAALSTRRGQADKQATVPTEADK